MLALTTKAKKLLTLLNSTGYDFLEDLAQAAMTDSVCPAICMTEGCDHIADMEKDQDEGHCEQCGGQTMTSALVLGGLI
jgi:hypothetical protein